MQSFVPLDDLLDAFDDGDAGELDISVDRCLRGYRAEQDERRRQLPLLAGHRGVSLERLELAVGAATTPGRRFPLRAVWSSSRRPATSSQEKVPQRGVDVRRESVVLVECGTLRLLGGRSIHSNGEQGSSGSAIDRGPRIGRPDGTPERPSNHVPGRAILHACNSTTATSGSRRPTCRPTSPAHT
jgi:hypothetical protein